MSCGRERAEELREREAVGKTLNQVCAELEDNPVSHPSHYTSHPSGVECKDIIKHMTWAVGTAVKYLWRCDHKHPDPIQDLEKAIECIKIEIERLSNE